MNYQPYLKKKTWSLEEAVFLVTGEQSDKNIKNSLTYKDAQRDIRKGILTAKKSQGITQVLPRDFIKWCNLNKKPIITELSKYFDYSYWLEKYFWSYDEAVMIMLSENKPPFPHEIQNVFELDKKHFDYATNLREFLYSDKDGHHAIFEGEVRHIGALKDDPEFIGKLELSEKVIISNCQSIITIINGGSFLPERNENIRDFYLYTQSLFIAIKENQLSSNSKIDFVIKSKEVDFHVDCAKKHWELMDKESSCGEKIDKLIFSNEEEYENTINFKEWLEKPLWNLSQALSILSGIDPKDKHLIFMFKDFDLESRFPSHWIPKKLDFINQIEELIENDFTKSNARFFINCDKLTIESKARPTDFINWAKNHRVKFPTKLNAVLENEENQTNISSESKTNSTIAIEQKSLQILATKTENEDEEVIFELKCIQDDLHYSIVKIFDYRIGKEPVFVGKKFKNDSEHGKFITTLCKKIGDKECIDINPSDFNLTGVRSSKVPNIIFKEKTDVFRPLFFEGTVSDKRVVFYKKITKKRLEEKGLLDKI